MNDKEIFNILREHIDYIDGGYACDTMPEKIVEAGRALIEAYKKRQIPNSYDYGEPMGKFSGDY